jgi:predicted RND superfamily exporter protein
VLSKIPCLVPLVITAGIMGYFGISFKPSTILIFSIAFGLASDGTIYILTEYRQQLNRGAGADAIANTVREVGLSMIYTNIILFFGFAIFIVSSFGGTVAMGVLISITLLCSLCTNLLILPAILLTLEKRVNTKNMLRDAIDLEVKDDHCEQNEK